MIRETPAVLIYEPDRAWTFLRLGDDIPYGVLDAAENALHGRADLDELKAAAEDAGDGTRQLEIGTVTLTDDGQFDELIVDAEPAA